ncbi:MAG: hypothetical protein HY260_15405 [Chloroflexi bacterium]|nr:hypothetical protein [Chloroflexota bacterium]
MKEKTGTFEPITRAEALAAAERCARLLRERFGARRVIPFGSVRGDGPWHVKSDLDLAVEGLPPDQFFRAWGALREVAPAGLEVDLVPLEDAYPEMRARILQEVAMPQEPFVALRRLIDDELTALARTAEQNEELLKTRADLPTWVELRAMAGLVHEFYTGCERILERIAVQIDGGAPSGAYSHSDLLAQVTADRPSVRPPVLDEALRLRLQDYLDFRHFFRHGYGYTLDWAKMRPLVETMGETLAEFNRQLTQFFEAPSPKSDQASTAS